MHYFSTSYVTQVVVFIYVLHDIFVDTTDKQYTFTYLKNNAGKNSRKTLETNVTNHKRMTYFIPDDPHDILDKKSFQVHRNSKRRRYKDKNRSEKSYQLLPEYTSYSHDNHVNQESSVNKLSKDKPPIKERKRSRGGRKRLYRNRDDLSLWIDEHQIRMFSGYTMKVYVIADGNVNHLILDPEFEDHLPIIPEEVETVNFTWFSSKRRYFYHFDLTSHSPAVLHDPTISIPAKGKIPRKPKVFSIVVSCTGNISGVATFTIGLAIHTKKKTPLLNTPLRLKLRKECYPKGQDPICDQQCQNGGICDLNKRCRCPDGYMGPLCATALCYPQCRNGGTCSSPGRCSCPPGFQGRHCEGGICEQKCLNGGRCVQKDVCSCTKGFYGKRCEFSKCVIPCVNGGKCKDVNKCRCNPGYSGNHCERTHASSPAITRCRARCRQGACLPSGQCRCNEGYSGKWCRRKGKPKDHKQENTIKRKLWV